MVPPIIITAWVVCLQPALAFRLHSTCMALHSLLQARCTRQHMVRCITSQRMPTHAAIHGHCRMRTPIPTITLGPITTTRARTMATPTTRRPMPASAATRMPGHTTGRMATLGRAMAPTTDRTTGPVGTTHMAIPRRALVHHHLPNHRRQPQEQREQQQEVVVACGMRQQLHWLQLPSPQELEQELQPQHLRQRQRQPQP